MIKLSIAKGSMSNLFDKIIHKILKSKIIESCYNILEWIYRANVFQSKNDKKEIVVQIQMLNFYLEEALRKDLLTNKKFINYTNHLLEIDKMVKA